MNVQGKEVSRLLFGGAFDPPHEGHLACLESGLKLFPKAIATIVPTFSAPPTSSGKKQFHLGFKQRIKACQKMFKESELERRIRISEIERELEAPNYSVNTIEYFCKGEPEEAFCFVMGQDQFSQLHRWHQPRKILEMTSLLVFEREVGLESKTPPLSAEVEMLGKRLGLKIEKAGEMNVFSISGFSKKIYLHKSVSSLSSTDLRRRTEGS